MGSLRRAIVGASALVWKRQCPAATRYIREDRGRIDPWWLHQRRFLFQEFVKTVAARNAPVSPEQVSKDATQQVHQEADPVQVSKTNATQQGQEEVDVVKEEPKIEQEPARPVKSAKHPVSWLSFFLLLITGGILMYYYDQEKKRKMQAFTETNIKYGPSAGKAAIGGPFTLVNHDGKTVTHNDFKGNWTLIYFGFTSCPDICPDELQKMVQALDKIEKKNKMQITPLFISIDPERDTVEQVREYVHEFHPRLIGLTGATEDVKKAAKAFRVYYMKTGDEGDEDYLVDHSIIMYLMDKDMQFVKFFGKDYTADELADGIIKEIKNYKPKVEQA